ncbi:DUF742 domain-containing protein [Streptomyces sp. NPDC051940]|uniref:DUF742 domain-containing protein n=1 Tax=Streptomyces sp. NPDC051940 TaxID=3155675 RepID=UPI00342D9136
MSGLKRSHRDEDPDRLYTLTGGRSRPSSDDFDLVTLVVSECEPAAGMQKEHVAILRMCRFPTAVVEIAAELKLPVSITKILLADLLVAGKVTARHPRSASTRSALPDSDTLERLLVGLRRRL